MAKSILELERAVRGHGKDHRRSKAAGAGLSPALMPPATASRAVNNALSRSSRLIAVRALDAVDVAVSGTVAPLRQQNAWTCWATVYTMLANWKSQRSETVESAIAAVGPRWSALLAQGDTRGLSAAEKVDFLADAGLVALPPQNPLLSRLASMLREYGPLWVTTDEDPPNLMVHARVLLAMRGDGTPSGTALTLIDPATGTVVSESFETFLAKFEAEVANTQGVLRVQVVHWPAGARAMSMPPRVRAAALASNIGGMSGVASRRALLSTLIRHGIVEAEAHRLISDFEAEMLANDIGPVPLSWQRPCTFQSAPGGAAPTVPNPSTGDPRVTTREILAYFYPDRSIADISDDHVRLAARMFYSALEKQRLLNRLPAVPGRRPGATWLASQAVQVLWRELRGVSGFSAVTRNIVALQWRMTLDEIENGLPPTALAFRPTRTLSYVEQQGLSDWINNPDIPLSPAVGGMSLDHSALEIADIIVSTTTEAPSIAIRRIGSPVSHVMLYLGGGMVVEAIGDGVVTRPLSDALAHSYVGVAFRHPSITTDQALMVRDFVGKRIGAAYDYDLIVAHARYQLGRMVCQQLPESQRDRCLNVVGPVDIGRGTEGRFICSSLVAEAFESVDLPLLPLPPRGTNPSDIALSANLIYLGHVKYDPPSGLMDRLRRL